MKARAIASLTLAGTLTIGLLVAFSTGAEAKNKDAYLPAFKAAYPELIGTRVDTCELCHDTIKKDGGDVEYKKNEFAKQWKEADKNFPAVENLDADDDGYTNLQEIQAGTFPGVASDNPSTVVTTTTIAAPAGSGEGIYQANCAACHGGNGGDLVPTSLPLAQLSNVVSSGQGSMPGFSGTLTSGEIQLVAEYLLNWSGSPTPTTTTVPGFVPDGAAVWAGSCAGCHGANGGNLISRGLSASQVVSVTNSGTAGMPGFSSQLSTAEVDAVASYVASLAPPPTTTTAPGSSPPDGGAVWAASCSGCHGSNGGDLAGRGLGASRVVSVTTSGTSGMPGFSTQLSTAEIDAVASYVASLGAPPTTTTIPGATPPSGAAVYAESCASCHGAAGGNLIGHSLTNTELRSVTVGGQGSMSGFGNRLSSDQIDAVVAYLSSVGAGSSVLSADSETADTDESAGEELESDQSALEEEAEVRQETAGLSLSDSDESEDGESPFIVVSILVVLVAIVGTVGVMWLRSVRALTE